MSYKRERLKWLYMVSEYASKDEHGKASQPKPFLHKDFSLSFSGKKGLGSLLPHFSLALSSFFFSFSPSSSKQAPVSSESEQYSSSFSETVGGMSTKTPLLPLDVCPFFAAFGHGCFFSFYVCSVFFFFQWQTGGEITRQKTGKYKIVSFTFSVQSVISFVKGFPCPFIPLESFVLMWINGETCLECKTHYSGP